MKLFGNRRIPSWADSCGALSLRVDEHYISWASKHRPIEPIVSTLVRLSFPVAIVGSHYPVGLYLTLVANVATYALVGLGMEIRLRHLSHSD